MQVDQGSSHPLSESCQSFLYAALHRRSLNVVCGASAELFWQCVRLFPCNKTTVYFSELWESAAVNECSTCWGGGGSTFFSPSMESWSFPLRVWCSWPCFIRAETLLFLFFRMIFTSEVLIWALTARVWSELPQKLANYHVQRGALWVVNVFFFLLKKNTQAGNRKVTFPLS